MALVTTLQEDQLGQLRPADTTAASIFSPDANITQIGKFIVVCNLTASIVKYRIFHDVDGSTFDETTALHFDVPIAPNATQIIEFPGPGLAGDDPAGNVGVRTSVGNALNFTLYGAEIERKI